MDWTALSAALLVFVATTVTALLLHNREVTKIKSSERVDTQRTAVDGLHTVSEDAMALLREVKKDNEELRGQVKALLADNEAIRCRVRELEEKVQTMTASFSRERAGWQQEIHRLKRENRELEARGYGRVAEYDPTAQDGDDHAEGG